MIKSPTGCNWFPSKLDRKALEVLLATSGSGLTWGPTQENIHPKKIALGVVTIPRWSMYDIFTSIWVIYGVNVGKYIIHGSSGNGFLVSIRVQLSPVCRFTRQVNLEPSESAECAVGWVDVGAVPAIARGTCDWIWPDTDTWHYRTNLK